MVESSAAYKNVPLEPPAVTAVTTHVIDRLSTACLCDLAAGDEAAAATAGRAISHALDDFNIIRLAGIVAHLEEAPDVDDAGVEVIVRAILGGDAWPELRRRGLWPDLIAMVAAHYGAIPSGRVVEELPHEGVLTDYWRGDALHRDSRKGPARHYADGVRSWSEYWSDGALHRPHEEGPAFTYSHADGQAIAGEEFFEAGLWHRPSGEGPAIRRSDRDGMTVLEIYVENGLPHRDPREGPAFTTLEPGCHATEYYVQGRLHRDAQDGPACLVRDPDTGTILHEIYYRDGEVHRAGGPAITERAPDGSVLSETWFRDGLVHRDPDEGPASVWDYPDLGRRGEGYYVAGELRRDPSAGPAHVAWDNDGNVIEEEYSADGAPVNRETPPNRRGRRAMRKREAGPRTVAPRKARR